MRLDHFVLFNNHLTTTTKGDNMSKLETPSVTKSRGFQSSHNTWVQTMRFNPNSNHIRVWGRIKDTGVNYIVEGWGKVNASDRTEWVQIPCANLPTAQMHLISIMDKSSFEIEQTNQLWNRMEQEGKSYHEIMEKIGY